MRSTPAPIVEDHQRLAELIRAERDRGRTLVLTNGGFDLFHVGHVRYLRAAADEADLLIVALNSDDHIRAHKGPHRPHVPLAERMEIVAAMGCVDYVTCFDAPTVDALLELLRPDVHAKGTDWTPENLPETPTLERLGIRFAVVGDPKDHSTTAISDRLRGKGC